MRPLSGKAISPSDLHNAYMHGQIVTVRVQFTPDEAKFLAELMRLSSFDRLDQFIRTFMLSGGEAEALAKNFPKEAAREQLAAIATVLKHLTDRFIADASTQVERVITERIM